MTHKTKSRKKSWTAVLHGNGGYALFDHEGRVVIRCLDQQQAIRHHACALQALQHAGVAPAERYPIQFKVAEELSPMATKPFPKLKTRVKREPDDD